MPNFSVSRRSAGRPVASVEEVEITQSVDYSEPDIIYDEDKVKFDNMDKLSIREFVI